MGPPTPSVGSYIHEFRFRPASNVARGQTEPMPLSSGSRRHGDPSAHTVGGARKRGATNTDADTDTDTDTDTDITAERLAAHDWPGAMSALDARGYAIVPALLDDTQCHELQHLYPRPELFRSRVVMANHGYGRGEYQYFARPLPALVQQLRAALYARLVPQANSWMQRLDETTRFPDSLPALEQACAAVGQTEPTALLLKYGADDDNRLHQDLYGELVFPLQVVVLLNEPGSDFTGGELVLTEQRPRMQSRVEVVPLGRGDAAIFAGSSRPVTGSRGDCRAKMRHGVSRVCQGERMTLGIVFHDAK